VADNPEHWFEKQPSQIMILSAFDVILMRKDPPFDMNYIYATYFLEQAEKQGVLVVNKAQSLRDANEKFFALNFPHIASSIIASEESFFGLISAISSISTAIFMIDIIKVFTVWINSAFKYRAF
jgi:glutathione synthase/RimK-type ligase-like ATP-grasp enzyme